MSRAADRIEGNLQTLRDEYAAAVKLESQINDQINLMRQFSWEIRVQRDVLAWLLSFLPLRFLIGCLERAALRQHEVVLHYQARAEIELRPGYPWATVGE